MPVIGWAYQRSGRCGGRQAGLSNRFHADGPRPPSTHATTPAAPKTGTPSPILPPGLRRPAPGGVRGKVSTGNPVAAEPRVHFEPTLIHEGSKTVMDLVLFHCSRQESKSLLFLKKKKQEDFTRWFRARGRLRAPMGKSSLVLPWRRNMLPVRLGWKNPGWQVHNSP